MKFKDYLKSIGENPNSYSKKHNLQQVTVWRACNGKFTPRPSLILFIEKESKGKVALKDWA